VLSLGEFLGEEAANVVTTSSSWADEVEQQADGEFFQHYGFCCV